MTALALPESQQARLRMMISELQRSQAAGLGIPFLPEALAMSGTESALNHLKALPPGQLPALRSDSAPLIAAATVGLNTAINQLTEPQRAALRRGLDPAQQGLQGAPPATGFGRFLLGIPEEMLARNSARYAALRTQDDARNAAQQFAGLGLAAGTIGTFTAIGLDRTGYDLYRAQGFSKTHIAATARDARALGFQGRDDIDIAMRAPTDLRSAGAAVANAKTPAEKAAAQRRYDELVNRYEKLPDGDPRKDHALRFIRRANAGHVKKAQHDVRGARDMSDAGVVGTTERTGGRRPTIATTRTAVAKAKAAPVPTRADQLDDFGVAAEATAAAPASAAAQPARQEQAASAAPQRPKPAQVATHARATGPVNSV
jgi:hypothetical protein